MQLVPMRARSGVCCKLCVHFDMTPEQAMQQWRLDRKLVSVKSQAEQHELEVSGSFVSLEHKATHVVASEVRHYRFM